MKLLILGTLLLSIHSMAQAAEPIAVYGNGFSSVLSPNAAERAKENAIKDAEKKCGEGGPIVMAENLGWNIQSVHGDIRQCRPGRFCDVDPTEIAASAIFVCRGNL